MRPNIDTNSPVFSFVLPAWKSKFIKDAIQSILNQTYPEFELIIVDDCSPDPIRRIVDSFDDRRITYYRNETNIGGHSLVTQWNHCLKYVHGQYLILATDDDLYESNFLSVFFFLIKKYPNVDLFRARILQVDAENKVLSIDSCYKELLTKDEFVYHSLHGMRGGIPHYIFKATSLKSKGGFVDFPKAWASDDATAIMMSENGVVNSQEHLVRFRLNEDSISCNQNVIIEKIKARLMYYSWLRENLSPVIVKDEKSFFLKENIDKYLPVYNKVSLLNNLRTLPFIKKMLCLCLICREREMTYKEKASVIVRSLFDFCS